MTKILGTTFSGIILDELANMFMPEEKQDVMQIKHMIRTKVLQKLNDPMYDANFVEFIMKNCVVSGGCSASIFHSQEPNDYDLYFKSQEALDELKIFLDKTRTRNLVKDVNPNYLNTIVAGKLITAQAVTLFNDIQLITMGTIDMIDTFDFIHCKPFYDLSENKYYISKKQYSAIKEKTLIINSSTNKPVEAWRLHKYKERGWKQLSAY